MNILLIIPYGLLLVFLGLFAVSSDRSNLYHTALIVGSSFIIVSITFMIIRSFLKIFLVSISQKGIEGDFAKQGVLCKIKEMRIWNRYFFEWKDITSIYVSNFKNVHAVDTKDQTYVTSVTNVVDFVRALRKVDRADLFDFNRTRSLLSFAGMAYGQGLLGMYQSSKEFSKLCDQIEEALK